jgi:methylglutaconyl-CoA hydratase
VETLQIALTGRGVARIIMNRPEVFNAFDEAMIAELGQAVAHCVADPAVIGPYLIKAVGPRQARRLALTASRIGAQSALQMGLVHEVVELPELDAAVEHWSTELLASGPLAQTEIKRLFDQLDASTIDDETRELTARTIARVRMGDEAREGFAAFLAKRPAAWISRD